ncbi:MAG: DNA helicase, partial [Oscillospiraceae bacterium]|nr:DNA helicase [Oscillospiraceae bacterium]
MTEYEVYSYAAYRRKYRDDVREVERASITSLDEERIDSYLKLLKPEKPNLSRLEDAQILELMCMIVNDKTTLAAQMLFGLYPQAYFPQLGIIAVSVPGTEIGQVDLDGSRFIDNQRIEGSIPEMLKSALKFVRTNTRKRTIIDPKTGERQDRTDYP